MKRLLLTLLLSFSVPSLGQLIFDGNTGTTGVQNGAGVWDTSTANWWNPMLLSNTTWNDGLAQFGSSSSAVGGTITVNSAINATGLDFLPLSAAPTTTNQAYHFSGTGSLNLTGAAPIINIGNLSTSGSSTAVSAVNFLLPVNANNLTIQKNSGTAMGFVRFTANNTGLTGLLTLKGDAGGIFLGFGSQTIFPNVTAVVVESNSVAQLLGTDVTYNVPFRIAGGGGTTNWGAIRMDSSVTLAGGVALIGDARIHTHTNVINSFITSPITEVGGSYSFTRTALLPTTATAALSMTYTAANTYTGSTNFGRAVVPAFPTFPVSAEGGLNVLDFAAAGAPASNIFYNGVTPGALNLFGGHALTTVMRLRGKAGETSSQTFGDVTVAQNRSEIELISGAGGTMNLAVGAVGRTGNGVLSIKEPVSGSITTTVPTPFLGAWATFTTASGSSSWAAAPTGTFTGFTGDTVHATGAVQADASAANLQVGNASTQAVTFGPGTTNLNTVSMTDTWLGRSLEIGVGQTLRLGAVGGIQAVSGAYGLTVNGGKLTAGGADNTVGQVILTNFSTSDLAVNSVIENNGTGAVSILLNGSGKTVLAGANTYTGQTTVNSGSLEIRHGTALGTGAGYTQVLTGASLLLSGGISTAEQIILSGRGVDLAGALRNVSGTNTITTQTVAITNTRIHSDAGELILSPAGGATAVSISAATVPITFGGAGNITVTGRVNTTTSTSAIIKEGTGTLVLGGDNIFTGTVTVSAGTLRIMHNNALGTVGTSATTTVSTGAALELSGGITTPETMNVSGAGVGNQGAIRSVSGSNTMAGTVTLGSNLRLQAESGSTLNFDVASGNSILHSGTASISVTFAGNGTINVADPIAKTGTGTLGVTKSGNGSANIRGASPTVNGSITANGGILNLDYANAPVATVDNLLGSGVPAIFSGGVLQVTGRSGSTVGQAFGAVTVSPGSGELRVVQNGGTNVNVALGAISRPSAAGMLRFTPGSSGALTTTGGADNAVLTSDSMAFATVGASDWAATGVLGGGVRSIVGLSTLVGGYTDTSGGALSGHADVTTATVSVPDNLTTSTVRFNTAGGSAVTIAAGKVLTTGGILVGEGAGATDVTLSGGILRSSSTSISSSLADLMVIQNNTAAGLIISSVIANNATASSNTGFTKTGPGTVYLDTVSHTYSGTTRVVNGTLHLRSGNISASSEVTLGAGSTSGVLKLGSGSTAVSLAVDWLRTDGTGTGNAVVGGATAYSTFTLDNNTVASDFRAGMLGGTGVNEDNLNFRLTTGGSLVATLGPANTYKGKTTMLAGVIEATLLANAGLPSSLGRGDQNAESAIIDMSGATVTGATVQAVSTLRYIGSVDSVTDRIVRITNADVIADTFSVLANLENTGTGTVKFTSLFTSEGSNTAPRTLRLGGTQVGANEIVGISNAAVATTGIEKYGTGSWTITGDSPHTGSTTVSNGLLQLGNGGTTGSVASMEIFLNATTAVLSTKRSDTLTMPQAITGTGTLRIDNTMTGVTRLTSDANAYGNTVVQSGSLLANNGSALSSATGTGPVLVHPGATLGGIGRIAPALNNSITIVAGTLSVGDFTLPSPTAADLILATSGTGSLSLQAGSVFAFDLFSGAGLGDNSLTSTAADLAVILGRVSLGTDITLLVSNPNGMTGFAENDSWKIFDWSGLTEPVSGSFTSMDLPVLSAGLTWDLSELYTGGILSIALVPEPSRLVLVMLGFAALLVRRRRVA
jgi:fibronectin-binding autotransporter adhesin